jgi:hypothetical protein
VLALTGSERSSTQCVALPDQVVAVRSAPDLLLTMPLQFRSVLVRVAVVPREAGKATVAAALEKQMPGFTSTAPIAVAISNWPGYPV